MSLVSCLRRIDNGRLRRRLTAARLRATVSERPGSNSKQRLPLESDRGPGANSGHGRAARCRRVRERLCLPRGPRRLQRALDARRRRRHRRAGEQSPPLAPVQKY